MMVGLFPFIRRFVGPSALLLVGPAVVSLAYGHEGHAPLPSKGALVDAAKGTIVLSAQAQHALRVETAEVVSRKLERRTLAYALLTAPWDRHAFAASAVGGRVTAVHVQPGQAVCAGQKLAELESLELETIQLALLSAQAELELSRRTLAQMTNLAGAQIAATRELSEARARHEQNRGAVAAAISQLSSLGVTGDQVQRLLSEPPGPVIKTLEVTSPIAGAVIHVDLTVGQVVTPNEHLFEIVDVSKVWVKIGALERDLQRIAVGQPVELSLAAYPNEIIPSTVQVKGLLLDPLTHLGTVWSEIENQPGSEPRFLPGMYGQAQIVAVAEKPRLTIPTEALVNDGLERYVLVEEAATAKAFEYRKRNVVVEGEGVGYVALRDGAVFPGDRVVTKGSHELATFFVSGVLRLSPEAAANMGLRVEPIRPRSVEQVLEFDGAIDVPPEGRASVAAQLDGRLTRILVERGQVVVPGQVIAEVSSLELQQLQLELIQAAAQTRLYQESLDRLRTLDATQSVPRRRVWEAQTQYNEARGRLDAVSRKLLTVGLTQAQLDGAAEEGRIVEALPIRAPIGGSVVQFEKVLGQVVRAEETLFEIHDLAHVWIKGFLTERDFARAQFDGAKPQARVRFVFAPNVVVTGTVQRSGNVLGAADRTLAIWVELDTPSDLVLQHNMLARVSLILGGGEPALAVPRTAVMLQGRARLSLSVNPTGRSSAAP
jgi:cobalt-zinc-cadmium efflux system membrane fusion protein